MAEMMVGPAMGSSRWMGAIARSIVYCFNWRCEIGDRYLD